MWERGRTDAKTYYNLDFAPNDAYTIGGSVPRVAGSGLGVGLDWRDYFLKFTHDERANFTSANMNRLVTGLRF